jgi:hypothetical protein
MVTLQGNLCPQKGRMANPFNNEVMPDLSCPALMFGGKKTKKQRKYKKLSRKLRSRKQKGSKRRYSRRH